MNDLKKNIRSAAFRLSIAYFVVLIVAAMGSSYANFIFHERLAEAFSQSARNSLLVNDLRQSVAILNPSIQTHFSSVVFHAADGSIPIVLPTGRTAEKNVASFLNQTIEIPISSDSSSTAKSLNNLQFTYSWLSPLIYSSILWLLILVFAAPIFRQIRKTLEARHKELLELRGAEMMADLTEQVSHDIRSPLAALNTTLDTLDALPEQKRKIIHNAAQRINDIANQLLITGRDIEKSGADKRINKLTEPTLLALTIDSILNEKRMQFKDKTNLRIQTDLTHSYGLFSNMGHGDLARILSNLINNSVEAISASGLIKISIRDKGEASELTVQDSGNGIPPEILKKLGKRGVTFGKNRLTGGGSGLGIFHAKTSIEKAEGQFLVESVLGTGTRITITLPKVTAPAWFANRLNLPPGSNIITVGGDGAIHREFSFRFTAMWPRSSPIQHIIFFTAHELIEWASVNENKKNIFIIDSERLGQSMNGLEIAEQLGIQKQSILLTSRLAEVDIRKKAIALGVKLLPREQAGILPFSINRNWEKYSAVVIDNDEAILEIWNLVARQKSHKILCFSKTSDFFDRAQDIDFNSPLFIDVNLGQGIRGEQVAVQAASLGFTDISLSTGYSAKSVRIPPCVRRVVGKEPILENF